MKLNAVITPLTCVEENNHHFVEKAEKEKSDYIPKRQEYHVIEFQSKSMQKVGETEIEVSSIEKMKCFAGALEIGKPAKVVIDCNAFQMDGKAGVSFKIVGLW